jgi:hypothetical protein
MSGRLRFTAVLVVLLVIGLAGLANSDDGDPIIVGQTVTGTSPTVLNYPEQIGGANGFTVNTTRERRRNPGFLGDREWSLWREQGLGSPGVRHTGRCYWSGCNV